MTLSEGEYRIEVPVNGNGPGTYYFLSYAKPAPQEFAYTLGQTVEDGLIGGTAAPGAGNLETTTSLDVYRLTVSPAQAGTWVFEAPNNGWYPRCTDSRLVPGATGGTSLGSVCGHFEVTLSAGEYRIEVPINGNGPGMYYFLSYAKPAPQEFAYVLGQVVQDGLIGGNAAPGAGNLETTTSLDVYRFTVAEAGTWVFEAPNNGWYPRCTDSRLMTGATGGVSLGSVCGHLEVTLPAGQYRIEVPINGNGPGTYYFMSTWKPAPQEFTYSLGQTVATGTIGGVATTGAGNLETALSRDVYTFNVTAAQAPQTWVFDGSGVGCSTAAQIYPGASGGTAIGTVCGHLETTLAAGAWRIEVPASASVSGEYTFTSYAKPAPQEFSFALGQAVADGSIGGVVAAGAGNLETTTSVDVYRFTVSAGQAGRWIFDGVGNGLYPRCSDSRLMPGGTGGSSLGSICGHLEATLAVGDYRIEVPAGGNGAGRYSFTSTQGISAGTPTIGGNPQVGQTLAGVPGAWTPVDVAFAYQWLRNGTAISGATASTYVVQPADKDQSITVAVTGSKAGLASDQKTSSAVTPVAAVATSGSLVALAPARLLDTRTGNGASGPVAPSGSVTLQVAGRGGVPATGVAAVVLNVTVTETQTAGFITVYPSGTPMPTASNLNYRAGQTLPNLTIVKLGADGKVKLANSSPGTVQLLADVSGYYLAGSPTASGALAILDPSRLLDTRTGNGATGPVVAGGTVSLQVTGRSGVPAAGVAAVVVNVTVADTTAPGFITVYPSGGAQPSASNLNFVAGQVVSNLVMVKVGADGKVKLTNTSNGTVSLVADVSAYTLAGTPVVPGSLAILDPARVMDTRVANGATGPVAASGTVSLQVTGRGGVPATGVAAVVLNVTVTDTTASGFITAYPSGTAIPTASNLNYTTGQTVPNLVIVKVGTDGKVNLTNSSPGTVQMIADIAGYYLL